MNEVASQSKGPLGALSKFFPSLPSNELGAGIQASFAIVGYKGKVWSYRFRGETRQIMRPDGDGPANGIDVVIVKAPAHLSKIYYKQGYVEGSTASPDCFSNDSIKPDVSAKEKQNPVCPTCRWNAWGSRVTQIAGRQSAGKACSDSKRLAIVPLTDLRNDALGGPMLLRVPPASLQDLALYGSALAKYSYPYFGIATRISFDTKEAFPKFNFQAIRALTDDEAQVIIELQKSPSVDRLLAETGEASEAAPVAEASPFEATLQERSTVPERAKTEERANTAERATDRESSNPPERAIISESTKRAERSATNDESAIVAERAITSKSANASERTNGGAIPQVVLQPGDEGFEEELDKHLGSLLPT